ncbi:MAG TPA: hypothetical protein VK862_10385, partial [Afifellaceae bacterium]|nr:hypothetical protein [Afifellaceae bacterium]
GGRASSASSNTPHYFAVGNETNDLPIVVTYDDDINMLIGQQRRSFRHFGFDSDGRNRTPSIFE